MSSKCGISQSFHWSYRPGSMFKPHTFYIRNRIVRWAKDPAFAMEAHDVIDAIGI